MEKEEILSTLTEKLGKTSFSQKTLDTYVEKHLPTEGAEPDDAYWTTHIEFLRSLEGQYNHDVANAVKEAKKNFARTDDTDKDNQMNTNAKKELTNRIESLEKTLADEKKKSLMDALRKSVSGKGSELKVSNKALWDDAVNMVNMTEGMDEDGLLEEAKKVYESKLKSYIGEGATPYGGEQHGGSSTVDEDAAKAKRDAFKKRMIAQGKLPKEGTN